MNLEETTNVFVAVHAGAGTHSTSNEDIYKHVCKIACQQALTLLKQKKPAMEAVTAAVASLEDAESTNAGRGSNLTMEGLVECDASVMDGETLYFGAVGALSGVKNPVTVAQRLAEEQKLGPMSFGRVRPSILVGRGAQSYCSSCGFDVKTNMVSRAAFKTYNKYKRKCQLAEVASSQPKKTKLESKRENKNNGLNANEVQDTVGAVCIDHNGNLAAASSSGGIWLKHSGRIGPAAVYGAGCWAQNQVSEAKAGVAAVTSGCGEHLIQTLLAKTCCDAVRKSDNFTKALAKSFQDDFQNSEFLKETDERFGGVLIIKGHLDSPSKNVELSWIHSTASMCLAYSDGKRKSPSVIMSRLNESVDPGKGFTMGGHMTTLI